MKDAVAASKDTVAEIVPISERLVEGRFVTVAIIVQDLVSLRVIEEVSDLVVATVLLPADCDSVRVIDSSESVASRVLLDVTESVLVIVDRLHVAPLTSEVYALERLRTLLEIDVAEMVVVIITVGVTDEVLVLLRSHSTQQNSTIRSAP